MSNTEDMNKNEDTSNEFVLKNGISFNSEINDKFTVLNENLKNEILDLRNMLIKNFLRIKEDIKKLFSIPNTTSNSLKSDEEKSKNMTKIITEICNIHPEKLDIDKYLFYRYYHIHVFDDLILFMPHSLFYLEEYLYQIYELNKFAFINFLKTHYKLQKIKYETENYPFIYVGDTNKSIDYILDKVYSPERQIRDFIMMKKDLETALKSVVDLFVNNGDDI